MYGGDAAVVTVYVSQRLRSKGRTFTIPFALRLTVSGGRISRYYIYEDSPTVSEAVAF